MQELEKFGFQKKWSTGKLWLQEDCQSRKMLISEEPWLSYKTNHLWPNTL